MMKTVTLGKVTEALWLLFPESLRFSSLDRRLTGLIVTMRAAMRTAVRVLGERAVAINDD